MVANLLYIVALVLVSPWIIYRVVVHGRYRRGWAEKLLGISRSRGRQLGAGHPDKPCLWIHAVSVGEVNLLPGLVERLRESLPETPIVISSSTDTGYDLARSKFGDEQVFFCPLDFTWAVRRTLRHLNVGTLLLAELELWPNLIASARRLDAQVVVFNARLSNASANGYRRAGFVTRKIFGNLSSVLCQDQQTAKNFIECGTPFQRVGETGSLKFDDAPRSKENAEVLSRSRWAGVDPWQVVWIVGSTQAGEEQMAIEVYQSLRDAFPELRLILVPRHPERFESVVGEVQSAGLMVHRRSCDGSQQHLDWTSDRVVLIDTIGELRHWWGVGHLATVGGSFGNRGGQNMLEPAGYGLAVSFGPNTKNFAEIADRLIKAGGAVRVNDKAELQSFVGRCLRDRPAADGLGRSAQQMIEHHRGALDRTIEQIVQISSGKPNNATNRRAA